MSEDQLEQLIRDANVSESAQGRLQAALSTETDADFLCRVAARFYGSDGAHALLQRASALAPTSATVLAALAESFAIRDEREPARKTAERTLAIDTDNVLARYVLMTLERDPAARLAAADDALRRQPTYFPAAGIKAEALVALRRREDAIAFMRAFVHQLESSVKVEEETLKAARATLRHIMQ